MAYSKKESTATESVFEITIPAAEFENRYEDELKKSAKSVKVSGFRPGKAPVGMMGDEQKDEARKKALEQVISSQAYEIIQKEKLIPAIPPSVSIKSFEVGKPITLTMTVTVIPPITLVPLSSLQAKRKPVSVEDKDVEVVEKHMWQEHRGKFKDRSDKWVAEIAPKLGFKAKTLVALRSEISEAIEREKHRIVDQEYTREALAEAIVKSNVVIPENLVQYEAEERERSFLSTLHQMNTTMEEFSKQKNVTIEELRTQWKKDAKEAIETDILLSEFARSRKIEVSDSELESEVAILKAQSKNPSDALFDNDEWRGYIKRVLLKRKSIHAFMDELGSSGTSVKKSVVSE